LITAAPQCPDLEYYEKNAVYNILHPAPQYDAYPDLVFVQFYNNYCSASVHRTKKAADFNFDVWDRWAREKTGGRSKILLGILGKENHMDTGYVSFEKLTLILDDVGRSKSFGGVMIWDAGYAYSNPVHYLKDINYGQATVKYIDQLATGSAARTALAFQNIKADFKQNQVPILGSKCRTFASTTTLRGNFIFTTSISQWPSIGCKFWFISRLSQSTFGEYWYEW
jgi:hypothetical protein